MQVVYIDSSAVYKLVHPERESVALHAFLDSRPTATSRLTQLEVNRASRRAGLGEEARRHLAELLERMAVSELSAALLQEAEHIGSPLLRSLDAIHLASAISLRENLAGLVAYDQRLLTAAGDLGIPTFSPR